MSELSGRTAWLNSVLASDDDTIDSITIAVACVLQRHMNAELVCHPSTRRIAAMARCSRNVAMDRVARLEKAGLLIVERHRRAVSVFQGLIPDGESGSPHEPDGGPGSPDEPGDLAHPMSQIPESGSPDE
ncbi:MAG TPA: hypothetical protein VK028_00265, partial [Micromonosporaceae bacterium]|nr:hypothetical protein [Micromonosporaceae bacterium]